MNCFRLRRRSVRLLRARNTCFHELARARSVFQYGIYAFENGRHVGHRHSNEQEKIVMVGVTVAGPVGHHHSNEQGKIVVVAVAVARP